MKNLRKEVVRVEDRHTRDTYCIIFGTRLIGVTEDQAIEKLDQVKTITKNPQVRLLCSAGEFKTRGRTDTWLGYFVPTPVDSRSMLGKEMSRVVNKLFAKGEQLRLENVRINL